MDVLHQLITDLTKEEIRFLKLFLARTNENSERKDLQLFDYIRKTAKDYDEAPIVKKLYGDTGKNAFYRLKNRLQNDIHTSIFLQYHDKNAVTYIYYLIATAIIYYERGHYKIAHSLLNKAEQKASSNNDFELLDYIYSMMIKYSMNIDEINPEEYYNLRKKNAEHLNKLKHIDEILAVISYKLKRVKSFSPEQNPIFSTLKKILDEISADAQLKNSPQLKFRIYETVSKILLQKKDYNTFEVYFLTTYLQFNENGLFNENNHSVKLQMLVDFANVLYNNKKYDRSLGYAEKLKEAMQEYRRKCWFDFNFAYFDLLIKNKMAVNINESIIFLEQLKTNPDFIKIPGYEQFLSVNLLKIWFWKKDFHKALSNLYKMYMYDSFTKSNSKLRINAFLTEIIIKLEINDFEHVQNCINLIKDELEGMQNLNHLLIELEFNEIIRILAQQPNLKKDKLVKKKIKKFLVHADYYNNNLDTIINCSEWVNEYLEQRI